MATDFLERGKPRASARMSVQCLTHILNIWMTDKCSFLIFLVHLKEGLRWKSMSGRSREDFTICVTSFVRQRFSFCSLESSQPATGTGEFQGFGEYFLQSHFCLILTLLRKETAGVGSPLCCSRWRIATKFVVLFHSVTVGTMIWFYEHYHHW